MASKSLSPAEKKQEAIIARESVAAVYELGRSLPDEVVEQIYADVVMDLARKAGLEPRIQNACSGNGLQEK